MICPLLKRFRMDRPECDFVALCTLPRYCVWAKFHGLDPVTAKPVGAYYSETGTAPEQPAQGDLFRV